MAKIWLLAGDYYFVMFRRFVKHIVDKQQFQDLYFALKIEKNRFINILPFETKEINFQLFC